MKAELKEIKKLEQPENGWHYDVPAEEYHKWNLCSHSRLVTLAHSPLHCKYQIDHPDDFSTPAKVIGEAIHFCTLQPELFQSRYVLSPKFDRRTTAGKEGWAKFQLENAGRVALMADDYQTVTDTAKAVHANEDAAAILSLLDCVEVSGVAEDSYGLRYKFRADGISRSLAATVDLKSTVDASPAEFERSIYNYDYHGQGAMYVDGANALGEPMTAHIIIAVEKEPPHGVAVYRIEPDALALGRKRNRFLMAIYRDCERLNVWPCYPAGIRQIGVPTWAYNKTN